MKKPKLAIVLLMLLAGCSGTADGPGPAAPNAARPISISSSLADGSTLTGPVSWSVEAGDSVVDQVDFLIDHKVRWTEMHAPYVFNDDGGVLAPWLLSPGKHVFTARATAAGSSAETTATVEIGTAPTLPAGLTGTFVRTVAQKDIDRTANNPGRDPQTLPVGIWTAHVDKGLLSIDDPVGSGAAEAFSATGGQLTMWGNANWLLPKDRQGAFCDHEPPGTFHWSRTGDRLIITGGGNCADRDALFVGIWQKQP
ncbi:MAG: hypothetical protein ABI912_11135 [Actinomycetota bacterium]